MCDLVSWGIMHHGKNGLRKGKVIFLYDEQMAHLMDHGQEQYGRSFTENDVLGHTALAYYYRLRDDDFIHREGLKKLPRTVVKAIKEGRLAKAFKAYEKEHDCVLKLDGTSLRKGIYKVDYAMEEIRVWLPIKEIHAFFEELHKRGIRWASNDSLLTAEDEFVLTYWDDDNPERKHGFALSFWHDRIALCNTDGYENEMSPSDALIALDAAMEKRAKAEPVIVWD